MTTQHRPHLVRLACQRCSPGPVKGLHPWKNSPNSLSVLSLRMGIV